MNQRRTAVRTTLSLVALTALAACAAVVGIDDLRIGDCKGGVCGADGGEPEPDPEPGPEPEPDEGGVVEAGGPCRGGEAGPSLVRVGPLGNRFCIDSTEVT